MDPEPSPKSQKRSNSTDSWKNILVVDDDPLMCFMLKEYLRKESFSVLVAKDGVEAIHLVLIERVDLIILDVVMPNISGPEFLKRIRNQYASYGSHIPVIIISAFDTKELKDQGYDITGYQFMTKPLDMHELLRWIKHLIAFGES
jgi:two-component system OmpR family response regulator